MLLDNIIIIDQIILLSSDLIFIGHFPKRALYSVALLRKMTCSRHLMALRHPVLSFGLSRRFPWGCSFEYVKLQQYCQTIILAIILSNDDIIIDQTMKYYLALAASSRSDARLKTSNSEILLHPVINCVCVCVCACV